MNDPQETEMKKCPYCGQMTPVKANFCRWCARELEARPERPDASSERKPFHISWVWIALIILVAAGVLSLILSIR